MIGFEGDLYIAPAPENVGGYFDTQSENVCLSLNLALFGDYGTIYQVVYHEGMHGGRIGEAAVGTMDESITQGITNTHADERGMKRVRAYEHLTYYLEPFIINYSSQELQSLIEQDDQATLENFIELIVLPEVIGSTDVWKFQERFISSEFGRRWELIQKLFPRLLNSLFAKHRGLEEQESDVSPRDELLEAMYSKVRLDLISSPDRLRDLLINIFASEEFIRYEQVYDLLVEKGYGYLLYGSEQEQQVVDQAILQVMSLRLEA